jgi:acylphosphatase
MVRFYVVKGRVQGVGFRWFVARHAAELALKGWVRNTEDGDVEITVAGPADQLATLRTALEKGSRGSRVDAVHETDMDESVAAELKSFQIEGAW